MKKQFLTKFALATLALTICGFNANAQLGNLKNKVKSAANNAVSGNKDDKKDEKKNDTSTNSSNSASSDVKVDNSLTGEQLVEKADAFYEQENYKEALANYEAAKEKGDYYVSDGMVRKRMNECRDKLDPKKQAEDEKKLASANAMLGQLEDSKYKCTNIEPDNGISSPMHTKYMKKIVFSKTEIVKGQENEANFTSSFKVEDNIYSRIYIDKSIINEAKSIGECNNSMPTYFIRWTFDDGATKLPEWLNVNIHNTLNGSDDGIYKWTTWQPQISWSESDMTGHSSETMYFVKYVKNLPVGKHKMKMELVYDIPNDYNNGYSDYKYTTKFGPERVLASGEFTIDITEAGRKQLYKKVCAMYKKDIAFYNKPAVTLIPNANELVKASKGIDWNKFTLLKVVSDYGDWSYKKNGYGIILSRSYSAGAYLLNKEDNFIYFSNVTFYQENISSGGAKYSATSASVEEQNIEYVRNYDSYCKECIGK